MSEPGATLEPVLESLLRRILQEEVQSLQNGKGADTLGLSNPVDRVKRLKSLIDFRTVSALCLLES